MTTQTVEEFRAIPSAPAYEVSNLGRVRRADNHRILTPSPCAGGYLGVWLSCGLDKPGNRYVHRLAGESFLGLTADKVIHHKNGARLDCRLENLEVCTQQINMLRSQEDETAHVCRGEANPDAWGQRGGLNPTQVGTLRRAKASGKRGAVAKLAREYGVSAAVAHSAARGDSYEWVKETAALTAIARAEALADRAVRKTLAQAARAKAARLAHTFPVAAK